MAKGKEQKSLLIPSFPCETCCNSRIFPILYKFVSFTLTDTTNHILRFFCVVNAHFLVRVASLWLRYEALLQWSPNSSVESRGALSPRVVLVVLPQHKHTTLILGILAQGWWNFSQPRWSLTQFRACKSHQRCFGSDLPSLELQECLEPLWPFRLAPFIIVPVGFGITKSQLCFISQNPFYLLKADVERGRPARGQGLNPLLPYICVYRFRNAGFGTEFDCVCSTHTYDVFTF